MAESRTQRERFAVRAMAGLTVAVIAAFLLVVLFLAARSLPILRTHGLVPVLLGTEWLPGDGSFGFYPFILGTVWVTLTALVLAVPFGLGTAIYLSEYAHPTVRSLLMPVVDLLAGIPSVIYGVWGVIVIVPLVRDTLAPAFGAVSSGYCILSGGIVLAIMTLPIIVSIAGEVMQTVPQGMREASRALGADRWQTVKRVVLRKAFPGIVAAVMLGFARAFGETMAVLMVVGNVARVLPRSVFDPAYPLPALIANNYGEMMSIPLYDSALMLAALLLLLVVAGFGAVSHLILNHLKGRFA